MNFRLQQTLGKRVSMKGFGLFGGRDVQLELCPAPVEHGVVFERTDLALPVRIPALIEYVCPQPRCTVIAHQGAQVAVIEHVMSALAGMRIDNCLVRLNAPEPPIGDGSALPFVELIEAAGIVLQDAARAVLQVREPVTVTDNEHVGVVALPPRSSEYEVGYLLNYGPGPIPPQGIQFAIQPDQYCHEIAPARTFVLRSEVQALQAQGIGHRATPQQILVFDAAGPIENTLRFDNECARHKLLDCIGDFALIGCDLRGRFTAQRSGHRLNHALIRELRKAHPESMPTLNSLPLRRNVG